MIEPILELCIKYKIGTSALRNLKAMHLPKHFVPPGVSDRLRFQSTAQMAMADTGSKYGTLESSEERRRKLEERKIGNTKTSIHFGFTSLGYETTARENDNYNRDVEHVPAGGDGGEAMNPIEMKRKGQKVNWDFGDAPERDWDRASTLADPTGPNFTSYRGSGSHAQRRRLLLRDEKGR
jgi:hypothetical protein